MMDFFIEDASLPAQYWDTFAKCGDLAPEKRLLAAVLEDAVENYRTFVFKGGRRFVEEKEWIFSDDNKYAFSFGNICDILGLSASRIRQSLRAWPASAPLPPEKSPRPARRPAKKALDAREKAGHNPAGYALAP